MKERDDETATTPKKEQRKNTLVPTTKARAVLEFLEDMHWGPRSGDGVPMDSIDKLVLAAAYGPAGRRVGPTVKEWTFAPKDKPTREKLVELANQILTLAETDCDALRKPTTYSLAAFDLARGDRAIGRVLLRIAPSGTRTILEDERYGDGDDEESGALSTKLLLTLLNDERRDKRWLLEQTLVVVSGAAERDAQRIERMEAIVDGAFAKQVALLEATEKMLSGAADRKAKAEWETWRREKFGAVVDKVLGIAEVMLPHAIAKLPAASATGIPIDALRDFIKAATEEQMVKAFGDWDDSGCRRPGVLTPEQSLLIMAVANGNAPVDELNKLRPPSGSMKLSTEQLFALAGIFSREQLQPLQALLVSAPPAADGAP